MIKFENVSKRYGDHIVLQNINLKFETGQFIALIGTSGCGKTTTLQMINRLIEPSTGTIYIDDMDIRELNPVELRRGIGYVIQEIGLFPHMTIKQNIEVVPKMLKWDKEKMDARSKELLKLVNMPEECLDRYPSSLSGGQQQRIGVLRALAADAPIILMDEPFGALDPITRSNLQDEIKLLQNKLKKTIVFVTHDMDEAIKIADQIVLMNDGEVVQMSTPQEMLDHPANDFVRDFFQKRGNMSKEKGEAE